MNHEELWDIADREIRLGVPDGGLMGAARKEAKGVEVHARKIYWGLRAAALQEEAKRRDRAREAYLQEIRQRLNAIDRKQRIRKALVGWVRAIGCFATGAIAFICFMAARSALVNDTGRFAIYAVGGILATALSVAAYAASKRGDGRDPFEL